MAKYMCPICEVPSDPNIYAMDKIGKKWYHHICLRKAAMYAVKSGFRLDEKLQPVIKDDD